MFLREWYADREVLLTGVTSEVGRVLLEKILRSFPHVKVYAVLRSRYGFNKDDRIKRIFASPGYERLRQKDPNAISRVTVLEGNLLYNELALKKEDRASLTNVSIAFHAAGPHDAMFELCQGLPRLQAVSAVSNVFKHKGQIAEILQNEYVPEIPLALIRLPLLGPAFKEPMPGFVEILKGPTAMMVGAGFILGRSDLPAQLLPVDLAVNALIVAAWERGTRSKIEKPIVCNGHTLDCTWGQLIEKGHRANQKFVYPTFGVRGMTSIVLLHWIAVILFEWLPSVISDIILQLGGGKPRILEEHNKVRKALRSIEPILSRTWPIERNYVYQLQKRLSPEDQETFPVCAEIDIETYILCAAAATKKYCVDEDNMKIVRNFTWIFLVSLAVFLLFILFMK